MAMLVFFHTNQSVEFVEQRLMEIRQRSGDLFTKYYPLLAPREADDLDREVLREYGADFDTKSMFYITSRPRKEGFTLNDAIAYMKKEFSDVKFAAENEGGGLM
ncbi:MAG TPA: hypothetical protein DCS30_09175 [Rhizobiales bacterium]|nr:hypothetical protein [Hyphomicrobiales bacterium]